MINTIIQLTRPDSGGEAHQSKDPARCQSVTTLELPPSLDSATNRHSWIQDPPWPPTANAFQFCSSIHGLISAPRSFGWWPSRSSCAWDGSSSATLTSLRARRTTSASVGRWDALERPLPRDTDSATPLVRLPDRLHGNLLSTHT